MSRELIQIINKWCDCCEREAQKIDGQDTLPIKTPAVATFVVGIGEGEGRKPSPRQVDVCDVHAKRIAELVDMISGAPGAVDLKPAKNTITNAALAAVGRPIPSNPSTARKVDCPVCKTEYARGSLVNHIWAAHRKDRRPELPTGVCPDCSARVPSAQGMGAHRRLTHGWSAVVEALAGVKGYRVTGREGDL